MKNGNNSNSTQSISMLLMFKKNTIKIYLSLIKFKNQQLIKCIHMKLNEILSNY